MRTMEKIVFVVCLGSMWCIKLCYGQSSTETKATADISYRESLDIPANTTITASSNIPVGARYVPYDRTILDTYLKKGNKAFSDIDKNIKSRDIKERCVAYLSAYLISPQNLEYYKKGLSDEHFMVRDMATYFLRKNYGDGANEVIEESNKKRKKEKGLDREQFFKIVDRIREKQRSRKPQMGDAFVSPYRKEEELIGLYGKEAVPYAKEVIFNDSEDIATKKKIMSLVLNYFYFQNEREERTDFILDVLERIPEYPKNNRLLGAHIHPDMYYTLGQVRRIEKFLENYYTKKFRCNELVIKDLEEIVRKKGGQKNEK